MSGAAENATYLQNALLRVTESEEFSTLLNEIKRGARVVSASGLVARPARALIIAALQKEIGRPFAVVVESNNELEDWERDVRFWYCALRGVEDCKETVLMLPASESDPYAGLSPHAEVLEERALTLWRAARGEHDFVLLTSRSMAQRTVGPEELLRTGAVLKRDEDFAPGELVERLFACGYVREEPVGGVGQFSLRGGIVDVWPPDSENPVRVEFFGDTVDSIREFDADTQLSIGHLKEISIAPMREITATAEDFKDWSTLARLRWEDERYARALKDRTDFADEGETFQGWEWLMPLLKERRANVFDYLKDAVLIVDEPATVEKSLGQLYATLDERFAETDAADVPALRPEELFLTAEELRARLNEKRRVELRSLGKAAATTDDALALETDNPNLQIGRSRAAVKPLFLFPIVEIAAEIEIKSRSELRYHGRVADLSRDLKQSKERGALALLVMQSHGMAERVTEMLREYEVDSVLIATGFLSGGFELPASNLIVQVEQDIFDESADNTLRIKDQRPKTKDRQKRKSKTEAFLSDFRDLKPNDYVVHIDHGVARFGGLQTLSTMRLFARVLRPFP